MKLEDLHHYICRARGCDGSQARVRAPWTIGRSRRVHVQALQRGGVFGHHAGAQEVAGRVAEQCPAAQEY